VKLLHCVTHGDDPWPGSRFIELTWSEHGEESRELFHFAWPSDQPRFTAALDEFTALMLAHVPLPRPPGIQT
jgi:hypothetical protein